MKLSKLRQIIKEEYKIIKEYGNQGPFSPILYLVKNDETFKEIPFSELSKVSNLIYDMGGGESSYYDEYNVVVIDNFPIKDFAKSINNNSNAKKKLYISYNLEKSYSFPKAIKIIISQLTFHLNNVEALAETVNNSIKSNGKIEFFSSEMSKKCKEFLKTLIDKYEFYLPDNITLDKISKYKSETLTLIKNKSYITPKEKKLKRFNWKGSFEDFPSINPYVFDTKFIGGIENVKEMFDRLKNDINNYKYVFIRISKIDDTKKYINSMYSFLKNNGVKFNLDFSKEYEWPEELDPKNGFYGLNIGRFSKKGNEYIFDYPVDPSLKYK